MPFTSLSVLPRALFVFLSTVLSIQFAFAASDRSPAVADISLDAGSVQRVLYLPATTTPRGVIVMFPGGAGTIGITKNGEIEHGDNFVVRTADLWRAKGYAVVLVDAIDRHNMRGERSTAAYAIVTRKIIDYARERDQGPVWVVGTSQGSIAAMNAAANAGQRVAGVVLTESVSVLGGSHETVFSAHPEHVTAPALVVANRDDQCAVAPPGMAPAIAQSMTGTHATVLGVQGGEQHSRDACGSLTPHGYFGIEKEVVDSITEWMDHVGAAQGT